EVVERRAQLRRWLRVRIGRVRRIARRLLGLSGVLTGLRRRARVRLTTRPRRGRARIRAAGLSLSRTGLRARLPRPAREDALDDLEVELRVAIGRIDAQRFAVRVARVIVPSHAEQGVPAVVLRDRTESEVLSHDRLAVFG